MRTLAVIAVGFSLAGCELLTGTDDVFWTLAEKGDAVSDEVIQKAADGYDLYCEKVPRSVQNRINERFNEATTHHDMPKWCPEG